MLEPIDSDETLTNARENYRKILFSGGTALCLGCDRPGSFYDRSIHRTMALGLGCLFILKMKNIEQDTFHIRDISNALDFFHNASDVGKNAAWGLVFPGVKTEKDEHKHSPGLWGITEKGIEFVRGKIKIPKVAIMYESQVMKFEGPEVSMRDCLGEEFDIRKIYEYAGEGLSAR